MTAASGAEWFLTASTDGSQDAGHATLYRVAGLLAPPDGSCTRHQGLPGWRRLPGEEVILQLGLSPCLTQSPGSTLGSPPLHMRVPGAQEGLSPGSFGGAEGSALNTLPEDQDPQAPR